MSDTVLITGASSGLGQAAANRFAAAGWNVVATMRRPEDGAALAELPGVLVTRLDVQDVASIEEAVAAGIARFGRVDVLVNNAGFSMGGVFESIPAEKAREQFDVNVFGVMDVTRTVLPHFRENRAGAIINISSRAGLIGMPLISLYSASKFALEGFSEALAHELAPLGIRVKLVIPAGGVATNFGLRARSESTSNGRLPAYDAVIARVGAANRRFADMRAGFATSAEDVADQIFAAASDGSDRLRYEVGHDIPPFITARREMAPQDYVDFVHKSYFDE